MNASKHLRAGMLGVVLILCTGILFAQSSEPQSAPAVPGQQPPAQPGTPNESDPRYRLAVDVELVNLTATVLDDRGQYIEDLKPEDFKVYEDGQEQEVSFWSHDSRVPVSVGVLIDISGSMRHKLQQALQMVREVSLALSPQDEMFLVTFNSDVEVRQRFTRNPQDIQRVLRGIRSSGETAAYDAIQTGLREMNSARHNKKVLLLVTDGFDTRSKVTAPQVEELLKRADVLVYAIGIDDDDNDPAAQQRTRYHVYHYMLTKLTSTNGGRAFRLFTGRSYALDNVASVLLEELHQQYTLSYYPTSASAAWRKVEVRVNKTEAQVRHRTGYYANQGVVDQE